MPSLSQSMLFCLCAVLLCHGSLMHRIFLFACMWLQCHQADPTVLQRAQFDKHREGAAGTAWQCNDRMPVLLQQFSRMPCFSCILCLLCRMKATSH